MAGSVSELSLTIERLREVLHYDPATGAWTWLSAPRKGRSYVGQRAGALKDDGYRIISVDGVRYRSNRLAWFYMTGQWPAGDVDHDDGDPRNDAWENLRGATRSQNIANGKARRAGLKGVTKTKWGFVAQIMKGGENHYLGIHPTEEAAHAAYVGKARELFGEFARAG